MSDNAGEALSPWEKSQSSDEYIPPDGVEWSYFDHVNFHVASAAKKISSHIDISIKAEIRKEAA